MKSFLIVLVLSTLTQCGKAGCSHSRYDYLNFNTGLYENRLRKFYHQLWCTNLKNNTPLKHYFYHSYDDGGSDYVEIYNSNISTIDRSMFDAVESVISLKLSGIHILKIEEYTFKDMLRLEEINISHNSLTEIKNNTFTSNNKLVKIDMSYNNLTNLGIMNEYLTELYLSNNMISDIYFLRNMNNLVILDLSYNKLTSLKNIQNLKNLEILNISHNFFQLNDDSFATMNKLKYLSLSNCKIKNLNSIKYASSLQYLNISYNLIENLKQSDFEKLTSLEILDLSNNILKVLNNKLFVHARKLNTIYLKYNAIETFPNDIFYKSINFVDLTSNHLSNIPCEQINHTVIINHNFVNSFCIFNENILNIDFSEIELFEVKNGSFKNLKQLSFLNLRGNYITEVDIDAFENSYKLHYLNLSQNFISNLHMGTFAHLQSLDTLDVSYNRLENIQLGLFTGLNNLQHLNLSHNNIKFIHPEMFSALTELRTLLLHGNPLIPIDQTNFISHLKHFESLSIEFIKIGCSTLYNMLNKYEHKIIPIYKNKNTSIHNIIGIECDPNEEDESDTRRESELMKDHIYSMFVSFILIVVLFFMYFFYYTITWCQKQFETEINIIKKDGRSCSVTLLTENDLN